MEKNSRGFLPIMISDRVLNSNSYKMLDRVKRGEASILTRKEMTLKRNKTMPMNNSTLMSNTIAIKSKR